MATIDPIAQFNQLFQAGDYNAAGALAAQHGYDPTQVSSYLNTTYGTNITADQAGQYMPTTGGPTLESLYQDVLGRAPDAEGLNYWQQQFGSYVDPNEITAFKNAARPELQTNVQNTYQTVLGRPAEQAGLDYWTDQLLSGSLPQTDFQTAFTSAAKPELDLIEKVGGPLLYPTLTAQSTPEQIAAAYEQYTRGVGGDTADAQKAAIDYLRNIGFDDATIQQAYQTYQEPIFKDLITDAYGTIGRTGFGTATTQIDQPGFDYWLGELKAGRITPENFGAVFNTAVDQYIKDNPTSPYTQQVLGARAPGQFIPESGAVNFDSLNKGFEWAEANKLDAAALKNALGEEKYNAYAQQYGQGILDYLRPVFADGQLSAEEALDTVSLARKYGLDASEIAKYTGLKQEVPDALFGAYDKVLSGIVGNALNPDSQQTEQQRTGSVLALQSKYGVTDAEIAKASDGKWTEAQVTDYLNPIRNFSTDIQGLFSKPDVTAKDIADFIDKSRTSSGVMSFYGDKINEFDQKLDTMEQKWERFGTDPFQTEQLYNQITGITDAAGGKNWSGTWMSGGDNAALEAAARLQKLGVDSLKDLKVTPQFQETKAVEMYNGQPVQTDADGNKFFSTYNDFTGGSEKQYLPAGAQTQITYPKVVGYAGESGGEYTEYVPLTADELKTYDPKTGQFDLLTGKNLIDASTGKVISNSGDGKNFVIDQYETGNFFKGSDKTFGIMMNDAGMPIPYTSTEKTGLVTTPILPLLAAFLVPQLAGYISSSLPGAAAATALEVGPGLIPATTANTLTSQALAGGIVSGGMAAANDQSFGKGFLSGAVNPFINYGIGSLTQGLDIPAAARNAINSTGTNLVRSAITGQGNVGDILTSGIMSGAADYFLTPALQSLNLSPTELKLLTNVGIPAAFGQKVNPYSLISTLASTGKPAGATK